MLIFIIFKVIYMVCMGIVYYLYLLKMIIWMWNIGNVECIVGGFDWVFSIWEYYVWKIFYKVF